MMDFKIHVKEGAPGIPAGGVMHTSRGNAFVLLADGKTFARLWEQDQVVLDAIPMWDEKAKKK